MLRRNQMIRISRFSLFAWRQSGVGAARSTTATAATAITATTGLRSETGSGEMLGRRRRRLWQQTRQKRSGLGVPGDETGGELLDEGLVAEGLQNGDEGGGVAVQHELGLPHGLGPPGVGGADALGELLHAEVGLERARVDELLSKLEVSQLDGSLVEDVAPVGKVAAAVRLQDDHGVLVVEHAADDRLGLLGLQPHHLERGRSEERR